MINWEKLQKDYDQLSHQIVSPTLNPKDRASIQRKLSQYSTLLDVHKGIKTIEKVILENEQQIDKEKDEELKELYFEEIEEGKTKLSNLNKHLEEILFPPDRRDKRSVFVEIRSGTGGQEAALFVADLFKMYFNYALSKNWSMSIIESNKTDIGGYSKIVLYIKGRNVYGHLKFESGVHRVQRVPETEASGRIHTSTITVAVLPEAEDIEMDINPKDLRIDVYRSSGAGGQHVNTTDSAVRITHIPTGVVVTCQDERSQIKNKAKAMKVLKSRLLEAEQKRKAEERSAQRKQQIGSGERSEKIRTYNFPQNRITDHRINLTLMKLDIIMEGILNDLIEPLKKWGRKEQMTKGISL
jgi:peptide chain release factor 1